MQKCMSTSSPFSTGGWMKVPLGACAYLQCCLWLPAMNGISEKMSANDCAWNAVRLQCVFPIVPITYDSLWTLQVWTMWSQRYHISSCAFCSPWRDFSIGVGVVCETLGYSLYPIFHQREWVGRGELGSEILGWVFSPALPIVSYWSFLSLHQLQHSNSVQMWPSYSVRNCVLYNGTCTSYTCLCSHLGFTLTGCADGTGSVTVGFGSC